MLPGAYSAGMRREVGYTVVAGSFRRPILGLGGCRRCARAAVASPRCLALTEPPSSSPGESALSYADQTLTCRDCGQAFVFTAGEQEFHASKGFENAPSRCVDCRAARKASRGETGSGYGGVYSSGGSGDGYSSGGGYGRSERTIYSAVCSECGQEARVPFQPRGDRPVYCSDCFSRQRGGATRSSYR